MTHMIDAAALADYHHAIDGSYFNWLLNNEAVDLLAQHSPYSRSKSENIIASSRKMAIDYRYEDLIFILGRANFCLKDLVADSAIRTKQLLENDCPTKLSLIFFIPRLVSDSLRKTEKERIQILIGLREKYSLPASLSFSFGTISLLWGLIHAHMDRTQEKTLLDHYVCTDTWHENKRLWLGKMAGIYFRTFPWVICDDPRTDQFGFFPLVVIELE